MPAPAFTIYLPQLVARAFQAWLRTQSGRSGTLRLGRFTQRSAFPSRASVSSAGRGYYRSRHNWSRTKLPVYGSTALSIPAVAVTVPAGLNFIWENPLDLPDALPQITLRPIRRIADYQNAGFPIPPYELISSIPLQRGYGRGPARPEATRRRHDAKLDFGLNRLYVLANKTLHPITEFLEFQDAFRYNNNPFAVATALAINQAMDVAAGTRGRLLRDKIYRNPDLWRLPVGYDTLSRIWR